MVLSMAIMRTFLIEAETARIFAAARRRGPLLQARGVSGTHVVTYVKNGPVEGGVDRDCPRLTPSRYGWEGGRRKASRAAFGAPNRPARQ